MMKKQQQKLIYDELFGPEDDSTDSDDQQEEVEEESQKEEEKEKTIEPRQYKCSQDQTNLLSFPKLQFNPIYRDALETIADSITLTVTRMWIHQSRSIPLSQRHVALPHSYQNIANHSTHSILSHVWSSLLTDRFSRKGILPTHIPHNTNTNEPPFLFASEFSIESMKTNLFDVAFLFRSFPYISENNMEMEESILRKGLIPGGTLLLTMHFSTCNHRSTQNDRSYPMGGTAQELVSLWKTTCSSEPIFHPAVWDLENASILDSTQVALDHDDSYCHGTIHTHDNHCDTFLTIALLKRPCTINTLACPWKMTSKRCLPKILSSQDEHISLLQYERRIVAEATITPSVAERFSFFSSPFSSSSSCEKEKKNTAKHPHFTKLSPENIQRAVHSLQHFGFTILRNLFDPSMVQSWGDVALQDFDLASTLLLQKQNVDILYPGLVGTQEPLSYQELAMREDLRVDLRDGPHFQQKRTMENTRDYEISKNSSLDNTTITDTLSTTTPTIIDSHWKGSYHSLRFHPDILQIVRTVFNPIHSITPSIHSTSHSSNSSTSLPLYKGNFGRWNFHGSGPDGTAQPLRIGQVGSIISLPGAEDQAIHADTPHLFEHIDCLPCHYANLFTLGCDPYTLDHSHSNPAQDKNTTWEKGHFFDLDGNPTGENWMGGTAFVHGSHKLSVSARLTSEEENGQCDSEHKEELHARIIRPSLQIGDALIFDCRLLHFGLANRYIQPDSVKGDVSSIRPVSTNLNRRPLLYVNMTHAWFHDPKNWDDKESIFTEEFLNEYKKLNQK